MGERVVRLVKLNANRTRIDVQTESGESACVEVNTRGCRPMTVRDREAFGMMVEALMKMHHAARRPLRDSSEEGQ